MVNTQRERARERETSLTNVPQDCCEELEVLGTSEVEKGPWAQEDDGDGLREESCH